MRKNSYKLSKNELLKIHTDVAESFCQWVKSCEWISESQKPEIIRKKMNELKALA
jgi:hypothetical protein